MLEKFPLSQCLADRRSRDNLSLDLLRNGLRMGFLLLELHVEECGKSEG